LDKQIFPEKLIDAQTLLFSQHPPTDTNLQKGVSEKRLIKYLCGESLEWSLIKFTSVHIRKKFSLICDGI
jgi:hypothetical protein